MIVINIILGILFGSLAVWLIGALITFLIEVLSDYTDAESMMDSLIMSLLWPIRLFRRKDG